MKSRIIKQYSCDFCKKKGLSASHISKHEKACTNNPNRICNMCKMEWVSGAQNITDLNNKFIELKNNFADLVQKTLSILTEEQKQNYPPWPCIPFEDGEKYKELEKQLKKHIGWLRDEVSGCPACMLSVIRQTNNCLKLKNVFDYKKEKEDWWKEINDEAWQKEMEACRYG